MIEFDARNSENGISGVQISNTFRGECPRTPLIMRGFGVRHGQGFRLDSRLNIFIHNASRPQGACCLGYC